MTTFVHYDLATGAIVQSGRLSTEDECARQTPPEGQGLAIMPDGLIPNPFSPTPDLSVLKPWLILRIDAQAEQFRCKFITPGSGQAMEYQDAAEQAEALIAGDAGPFPLLAADVAAGTIDPRTGLAVTSETEAADLILWTREQWRTIGAAIRQARLAAKVATNAATNLGEMIAAATVDWAALLAEPA